MALSKKDYVALANILEEAKGKGHQHANPLASLGFRVGVGHVEEALIKYLTLDNPRFDVVRFREASNFKVGGG